MNWPFLIIFGVGVLALLIFLIVRNQKDEKKFEESENQDHEDPGHIISDSHENAPH